MKESAEAVTLLWENVTSGNDTIKKVAGKMGFRNLVK